MATLFRDKPILIGWLRRNWLLLLAIFLCILPSALYLNKLAVQSYVEYFVPNSNGLKTLLYSWQAVNYGSNGSTWMWRLFPISTYYELFSLLRISPNIAQACLLSIIRLCGLLGFLAFARLFYRDYKIHRNALLLGGLFFVYNPYTLNYFASSYIILLPYYLLPAQLLFFARALVSKKLSTIIASVLVLAIINSVCFGVNLVFDVIAVAAMAFVGLFYLKRKEVSLRQLIIVAVAASAGTLLLIIWWISPMLAASTADKETSNFILGSESFYNIDTSPINLLKGLGEWGFFSGYKGQYYHNFAGWFRSNPLILVAGVTMVALLIFSLIKLHGEKNKRVRQLVLITMVAVIALLPFIGGTNASWPTAAIMTWAFQHIPYFGALRNTYKWMSLVMLLECIVICYGLSVAFSNKKYQRFKRFAPLVIVGLIISGTAPLWTGNIYEQSSLATALPSYWTRAISYMNAHETSADSRTLLLPNQYFSVYQWPRDGKVQRIGFPDSLEAKVFNTPIVQNICKGCGQYNTSQLLDFMYTNLQAPNLSRLMGMTNVTTVLQRNDYDYKYYGVESPEEIRKIASDQGLKLREQFGQLDLYDLPSGTVYPRVYSPSNVVVTNDLRSSLDLFDEYDTTNNSTAFIINSKTEKANLDSKIEPSFYTRAYDSDTTKFSDTQASSNNQAAQHADYNIVKKRTDGMSSFQLSYSYAPKTYTLYLKNIDGQVTINGKPALSAVGDTITTVNLPTSNKPMAIKVDGIAYYLTPDGTNKYLGSQTLPTGKNIEINTYTTTVGQNLLSNPSFETGIWNRTVTNCEFSTKTADIDARIVYDEATEGSNSLRLTARDDSACEYSPAITSFKPGANYLLTFDYKRVEGAAPEFCAWDGRQCLAHSSLQNDNSSDAWQTTRQVITTNSDTKQLIIYIYAPKNNYPVTTAVFDNFSVIELGQPTKLQNVTLPDVFSQYSTVTVDGKNASVGTSLVTDSTNLIDNGSFEAGLWSRKPSNCQEATFKAFIDQRTVDDGVDGGKSLELTSNFASACVTTAAIQTLSPDYDYVLDIDYKVVAGDSASYCIWDGQGCVKKVDLPAKNHQWQHYQIAFSPKDKNKKLSVYLYAQTKTGISKVRYDNITLKKIENKVLGAYSLKRVGQETLKPMELHYSRDNPTHYTVDIKAINKGMIILQESYQPLWRATVSAVSASGEKISWRVPDSDHKIANGYANAWLLNPASMPSAFQGATDITLTASFTPQSYFYVGVVVSGLATIGMIGGLVYIRLRRAKHPATHKEAERLTV